MRFTPLLIFIMISVVPIAFAEQMIISEEGIEYEIAKITEAYHLSKYSHITKSQGFTTTGEMFFLRVSDVTDFQKVMLLDREGHWQKAEMRDKIVEITPQYSLVVNEKTEFHYLLDQYDQVYNNSEYKLFIKTFDKSIYSGTDFQNFEGKISGAKISAMIIDPNGMIKTIFQGTVENGMFEGGIIVPENLWQRGWYIVDIIIEFEDEAYLEQLSFYVLGETKSSGGSSCPVGQVKVNGICV